MSSDMIEQGTPTAKPRRFVVIVCGIIILIICLFTFCSNWAFGRKHGNVFSTSDFEGGARSILLGSLRIRLIDQMELKHASMVGGKDWTLFMCFELPETMWDDLLGSVNFSTRKGQESDTFFESAALPWWKIDRDSVEAVLCATEGYTSIIAVRAGKGRLRIFAYTDGGPEGFRKDVWSLFKP